MDNNFGFEGNGLNISWDEIVRLIRFAIVSLLTLIIISNIFGIGIASAESGSISLVDSNTTTYIHDGTQGYPYTFNWSVLLFDSADYNYLGNFRYTPRSIHQPYWSFTYSYESTRFTYISGAIGTGGWVWYDRNSTSIYYVFDSGSIITSGTIYLSFEKNIFLNISIGTSNYGHHIVDAEKPVGILYTQPLGCDGFGVCGMGGTYSDVTYGVSSTDYYIVSYLSGGLFSLDIDKNNYVDSKYIIHGESSEYSRETTFNKVNIDGAIFTYDDGIWLNATLNSGLFNNKLVRANIPAPDEYVPPSLSDKCIDVPHSIIGNITQIVNTTFRYDGSIESSLYPGYYVDTTYSVNNITGYRSNWSSQSWSKIYSPNFTIETKFLFYEPDAVHVIYCAYNDSVPPTPTQTVNSYQPDLGNGSSNMSGVTEHIGLVSSGSIDNINEYTTDVITQVDSYDYTTSKNIYGIFIPSILNMIPTKIWLLIILSIVLDLVIIIVRR